MLSILGFLFKFPVVRFRKCDIWVDLVVDESVSERSDSELGSFDGGVSVSFESRGSRCVVTVGSSEVLPVIAANSSSVALLFTSCLVSKGVGVDGMQDSLVALTQRHNVNVKKKSERLACCTSLTKLTYQTRQ